VNFFESSLLFILTSSQLRDAVAVVGGIAAGKRLASVELLLWDPREMRGSAKRLLLPPMAVARARCSAVFASGRLIVAGGVGEGMQRLESCEQFDFITYRWSAFPSLPAGRSCAGAAVVASEFY